MNLHSYTKYYLNLWKEIPDQTPLFSSRYSTMEKYRREKVLDQFLSTLKAVRKDTFRPNKLESFKDAFLLSTHNLLRNGMDFSDNQLAVMFSPEMLSTTKQFVKKAKAFDETLPLNDIFQACRNVWIMLGIQMIMGMKIELTPSVFAYSMLYPYSDNFIDEPSLSKQEKEEFSLRFLRRLSGEGLVPVSKIEDSVFSLVAMIEEQYPRREFPDVFDSLMNIHHAQTRSMDLIHSRDILSDHDILRIAIEKGGASVLADGFLVAGNLNEQQKLFYFGYGAYLQLLDDIQDVKEDSAGGLMTVFSGELQKSKLDKLVNKTYWFGREIMQSLDSLDGYRLDVFKSLMKKSIDLFIIEAIAQTPEYFTESYTSDIEVFSPFHFSYIRKRNNNFKNYHGFLMGLIEEYIKSKDYYRGRVDVTL